MSYNIKSLALIASLLLLMPSGLFAGDDSKRESGGKSNRIEWPKKWFEMSAEKRRTTLEEIRKTDPDLAGRMEKETKEIQKRNEEWNALTPEQKEAKKKEWRAKMEETVNFLRTRKAEGNLSDDESRKLIHMEEWLKRLDPPREKSKEPKGPPGRK